ncbi:phage tail tube protein [Inquilinus sp.]|jgi:hypothetical protein|uniref:phage tail tube protein n=1 Tax=Inquilinus sp. TaxID=1932117 RepID=UPI003783B761
MARKFWRKKVLLVKPEVTYGTNPVPTGAANAILAENVELTPMSSQTEERGSLRPHYGSNPTMRTVLSQKIAYDVELAGAGTAGALPGWAPILRGCGFLATQTVGTDVVFEPVSYDQESMATVLNNDGTKYALLGGRSDAVFTLEAQKRPMVRYSYTSMFQLPVTEALPVPVLTGFKKPLIVNKANTVVTLGGWAAKMSRLTINLGNQIVARFIVGDEEVLITDRKVTGTVVVDAVALETFNPFALAVPGTTIPLHLVHGAIAGAIIELDLPTIELGEVTIGQAEGVEQWTIPFSALPSDAGDDEFTVTVK